MKELQRELRQTKTELSILRVKLTRKEDEWEQKNEELQREVVSYVPNQNVSLLMSSFFRDIFD